MRFIKIRFDYIVFTVLAFLLLIVFSLFFARYINLHTADLGRHIVNGRLFCESGHILATNFYSYTEPNFPTVTHHWGAGVLFYLLWQWVGFNGLTVFYCMLAAVTLLCMMGAAWKKSSFSSVVWVTVLLLPLLAHRTEIRPEGFSYFLFALYYLLLTTVRLKPEKERMLWFLPIAQVAWVNLHVFFPMGFFLTGVFAIDAWLGKRNAKPFFLATVFCFCASFLNPFFAQGVWEPFTILREYGYMVAENQSVVFMQKRFGNPAYLHFEIAFAFGLLTCSVLALKRKAREYAVELILFSVYAVLAWSMVRGLVLFAYILIPLCARGLFLLCEALAGAEESEQARAVARKQIAYFFCGLSLICLVGTVWDRGAYYSPFNKSFGLGISPKINYSADVFKALHIEGPIFNNYDIGGYLIFHMYPDVRPFVDNRPEAYSVSFFKDVYVRMQEDEKVWQDIDEQYGFNAIYFYRHDATPWAQPFLIRRLDDPAWVPIFVDTYTLIMIRNNEKNKDIVARYRLPRKMFVVRDTG